MDIMILFTLDMIQLDLDYSLIFTCTMDNRNTEHPYPSPTDPASTSNSQLSNGVLPLTTQGTDVIMQ